MAKLIEYEDLLANVRWDKHQHAIRNLVRPDDPDVKEVAATLYQAGDFVTTAQDFVHSFTTYHTEIGDYWATPGETMTPHCAVCRSVTALTPTGDFKNGLPVYRCDACGWVGTELYSGDCDDMSILLCSLLRVYTPADRVFCAIGTWKKDGKAEGHMWVNVADPSGQDRILEATALPSRVPYGTYEVSALFNDEYAFATLYGLKTFGLIPVEEVVKTLQQAGAIFS